MPRYIGAYRGGVRPSAPTTVYRTCALSLPCHSEPVTDVTGVGIRSPRPQARNPLASLCEGSSFPGGAEPSAPTHVLMCRVSVPCLSLWERWPSAARTERANKKEPPSGGSFSLSINPLYGVSSSFTQGELEGAKPASNQIKCRAKPCLARRAWSEATIFVPQGGTKITTLFQAVEKSRRLFRQPEAGPAARRRPCLSSEKRPVTGSSRRTRSSS